MNTHLEHVLEGISIGAGAALIVATVRYLRGAQRKVRREHHQLLRWAKVVGHKTKTPFPLPLDRQYEIDDEDLYNKPWEEGLS